MTRPVIPFQRPSFPTSDAIEAYFSASRAANRYSNGGPCHTELVRRVQELLGTDRVSVPVSNGTLALMTALRAALPARTKGRIVVPSFTFVATASAAVWAGFDLIFADVDPESWHLAPAALAQALERSDVVGVIAVTAFGSPAPLATRRAWEKLCSAAGVPLVVDSAAAFGAVDDDGQATGAQGDIETFSFHATKPLAIGEGGLVTTQHEELGERVGALVNFDFDAERRPRSTGGLNAKLDELHCATALAALDDLPRALRTRRLRSEAIQSGLSAHGLTFQQGNAGSTYQFVPALAEDLSHRDRLTAAYDDAGIEVRHYYQPLHRFAAFADVPVAGELLVTSSLGDRILSLPMADDLPATAVDRIVAVGRDAS